MRRYWLFFLSALFVAALDQATKGLITASLTERQSVSVIDGFFDLVNIRNRGAAFGLLNRHDIEWQFWLFLGTTILAFIIIFNMLRKYKENPLLSCGLGLILGGAIGNLIDRLRFRAVVDFLDFHWGGWHWPAFNIADSAICLGCLFLCIYILRQKPGNGKKA